MRNYETNPKSRNPHFRVNLFMWVAKPQILLVIDGLILLIIALVDALLKAPG
jgi:hypothetical protein